MAENEHGRIISGHAKAALAPIGFQRRGRSRVWLADHGYWLSVVEFQPSGFSKGSYCNVAVHWLWGMTPVLSFDYGFERVGSFAQFNDVGTFSEEVADRARAAAQSAEQRRAMLKTLPQTAALLASDETTHANPSGWEAFHAGVACGLTGDDETARHLFDRVRSSDGREIDWVSKRRSKVERLTAVLGDQVAFQTEVQALVDTQREHFKLVPYTLAATSTPETPYSSSAPHGPLGKT